MLSLTEVSYFPLECFVLQVPTGSNITQRLEILYFQRESAIYRGRRWTDCWQSELDEGSTMNGLCTPQVNWKSSETFENILCVFRFQTQTCQ